MPINSFLLPGAKVTTGYDVDNSCRFFSDTSLHKDNGASSTNRDKYTFSFWYKKCANGVDQKIIMVSGSGTQGDGNDDYMQGYFKTDDTFRWQEYDTDLGSPSDELVTTQVFRDNTAWMHFVLRFDSTSGTADDRMRIYVNGTQVTAFGTRANPDQNIDGWFGDTDAGIAIGGVSSQFCNGYLAEVVGVDGQSLAPTEFGEFSEDSPNIWIPKNVSGITLGNNGFYLDFKDSANLGNDAGGGTDFSEVNLAAADQATDTPTNNFCVINPLASNVTLSEGNLQFSGYYNCKSSIAMQNGKWYAECKITNDNTYNPMTGIGQTGTEHIDNPLGDGYAGNTTDSYHYQRDGKIHANGSEDAQTSLTSIAQNDIVGIAVDLDSGTKTCKWYINNTLRATQNLSETGSNPYVFWTYASGSQAGEGQWNFGGCSAFTVSSAQSDANGYGNFEYAPPSGYYALCTKNLAEFG